MRLETPPTPPLPTPHLSCRLHFGWECHCHRSKRLLLRVASPSLWNNWGPRCVIFSPSSMLWASFFFFNWAGQGFFFSSHVSQVFLSFYVWVKFFFLFYLWVGQVFFSFLLPPPPLKSNGVFWTPKVRKSVCIFSEVKSTWRFLDLTNSSNANQPMWSSVWPIQPLRSNQLINCWGHQTLMKNSSKISFSSQKPL